VSDIELRRKADERTDAIIAAMARVLERINEIRTIAWHQHPLAKIRWARMETGLPIHSSADFEAFGRIGRMR
jgi:hypothetical protein